MKTSSIHELNDYYFKLGYNGQCSRYPLLDHVWGERKYFWSTAKYPKKYQKYYRMGQSYAFKEGIAEKPWFVD